MARVERTVGESDTRFVDAVVSTEWAGARVAATEIVDSDERVLADVTGDLDIMLGRVAEGAPAAEKPLTAVRFPAGTLIVSDDDGHRVPRPDTTLNAAKRYVVVVEPDVVDDVLTRG